MEQFIRVRVRVELDYRVIHHSQELKGLEMPHATKTAHHRSGWRNTYCHTIENSRSLSDTCMNTLQESQTRNPRLCTAHCRLKDHQSHLHSATMS